MDIKKVQDDHLRHLEYGTSPACDYDDDQMVISALLARNLSKQALAAQLDAIIETVGRLYEVYDKKKEQRIPKSDMWWCENGCAEATANIEDMLKEARKELNQ